MKVEVKKLDKLKRTIKVEVDGEAFKKEKQEAFIEIGKNLKVPGFRQGNVPLDILEKQHGNILKEEFLKKFLPVYYQKALEENNLLPVVLPRLYDIELNKDRMIFSADLEVKPEISLQDSDYIGIKITSKKISVSDEEIKKVISNLKEGVKKVIDREPDDVQIAKWAGYPDFQVLKGAIETEVKIEKLRERRQNLNSQITKHLLKSIRMDVSRTEIEKHRKDLVDREIYNLRTRGVSDKDIEKNKKDIEDKLAPLAEDEVKLMYILDAVANKENIKTENNFGEVVLGFILSRAHYEEK